MTFQCILQLLILLFTTQMESVPLKVPTQRQIESVMKSISSKAGLLLAEPCSNRKVWQDKKRRSGIQRFVKLAETKIFKTKLPPWSDADYLQFSSMKSKPRSKGEKMLNDRVDRLFPLAMAECYHYNGKFIVQLNNELKEIAFQKSWAFPAHGMLII